MVSGIGGGGGAGAGSGGGGGGHVVTPGQTGRSMSQTVTVDDTKPTTRVQIRMPSGRAVAKFNKSHTIADLQHFVEVTAGSKLTGPYTMSTQMGRGPPTPRENRTTRTPRSLRIGVARSTRRRTRRWRSSGT